VPLLPALGPLRTIVANGRSCVPSDLPAAAPRRSPAAVRREKAWWHSLTPAQKAAVIQRNRARAVESAQRRKACVVLVPTGAATYAGLGLSFLVRRRRLATTL
jgi:hypothetical protein